MFPTYRDYLRASRDQALPRGEHESAADRASIARDLAEYRREYTETSDFIGPLIPFGEPAPMSPAMLREWELAWWEQQRCKRERRYGHDFQPST